MLLSFEQIKDITFGAISVVNEPDGIHFYRYTEKQTEAWRKKKAAFADTSLVTTGVSLDFHTTSENMCFVVSNGIKFEVYINGLLRERVDTSEKKKISIKLCDPLGHSYSGEKRVSLCFPSHDIPGVLVSLELDDGATVIPHKFDRKFLFIGDSITQGWASEYDSLSFAQRVSRFYNAESIIQGIGGTYYNEEAFDSIPFDPDAVFVACGTNDFGHYETYDELDLHVSAHMDLIAKEYAGKKIFVISPIWRGHREGKKMGTFEECRNIIAKQAEAHSFIHIDGLTLVPPIPEFFKDEYLHPNDNGFSLYAENLIAKLQKYI